MADTILNPDWELLELTDEEIIHELSTADLDVIGEPTINIPEDIHSAIRGYDRSKGNNNVERIMFRVGQQKIYNHNLRRIANVVEDTGIVTPEDMMILSGANIPSPPISYDEVRLYITIIRCTTRQQVLSVLGCYTSNGNCVVSGGKRRKSRRKSRRRSFKK